MKLIVTKDNYRAVWNDATGKFDGDQRLIEYIEKLLSFSAKLGSNRYNMLVQDATLYAIEIEEYEPDVYPEGTLDV
jgi:hypothetical protein